MGYTSKRLDSCSARVETYDNGTKVLVSYSTVVAAITKDGQVYVTPQWECSITTHNS